MRFGPDDVTLGPRWPRETSLMLLLVGLSLFAASFWTVLSMPDLMWHPARDAELQVTYQTYQDTGALLIKPTGTGSNYTQAPAVGPLSPAAWDDDPGSYVIASLLSHVTSSPSPYPGLRLAQAFLVSVPFLWLPLVIARIFRRARAGYALVLLPPLMWVMNGTILTGTEYGLSDNVSTLRVYALYGLAASMVFLSLSLLLWASTHQFRLGALVALTAGFGVLGGIGNLMRAMSGVGVAAGIGVIWLLSTRGNWRWVISIVASVAAIVMAFVVQIGVMSVLNVGRSEATGLSVDQLPKAHGTWHPLYLGLAFPQQAASGESPFGITWSDEFGWNKAREVDPDVLIASTEYDQIMKDLYLDQVRAKPWTAVRLYLEKLLFTVKNFGAMLIFILVGFSMAMWRRGPHRGALGATLAVCAPTVALALIPPVLVMPLLYYYSEMSAVLGLLVVVSLGALVWVMTSLPAQVRADERRRLSGRRTGESPEDTTHGLTVVIPSRNGQHTLPGTLDRLGSALSGDDEILVVENGSTDGTRDVLKGIADCWSRPCSLVVTQSEPGLGNALRTGAMGSRGARLLLSADDLPFGMTDLEAFRRLPDDVVVAVGSKAHPDSSVPRTSGRVLQSRIFRFLRSALLQSQVGDSQGTLWVDGVWVRNFAQLSHEQGLMWTTELILAAEQQGLSVLEVPVTLDESHETGESRFRLRDGLLAVIGFIRLAVYKDDYVGERWVVPVAGEPAGARP